MAGRRPEKDLSGFVGRLRRRRKSRKRSRDKPVASTGDLNRDLICPAAHKALEGGKFDLAARRMSRSKPVKTSDVIGLQVAFHHEQLDRQTITGGATMDWYHRAAAKDELLICRSIAAISTYAFTATQAVDQWVKVEKAPTGDGFDQIDADEFFVPRRYEDQYAKSIYVPLLWSDRPIFVLPGHRVNVHFKAATTMYVGGSADYLSLTASDNLDADDLGEVLAEATRILGGLV